MKNKTCLAMLLILILAISLTACGETKPENDAQAESDAQSGELTKPGDGDWMVDEAIAEGVIFKGSLLKGDPGEYMSPYEAASGLYDLVLKDRLNKGADYSDSEPMFITCVDVVEIEGKECYLLSVSGVFNTKAWEYGVDYDYDIQNVYLISETGNTLLGSILDLGRAQAIDPTEEPQDTTNPAQNVIVIGDVSIYLNADVRELDLSEKNISDLSPLKKLSSLERLILCGNQISDVSPLTELKNLKELNLAGNQISDLSPLSEMTQLEDLTLNHNQISDLRPLENLTNLKSLRLAVNAISDLQPLTKLSNLETLDLPENQITDITPLAELKNLQHLTLFGNPIEDWSPVDHIEDVWGRPRPPA